MRRTLNTEDETRLTNLSLMQQKRRKQLLEQLENKQQLLAQYTNSRGIGMKGATVPQRDIDMLNHQIAELSATLAEFNPDAPAQRPAPQPHNSTASTIAGLAGGGGVAGGARGGTLGGGPMQPLGNATSNVSNISGQHQMAPAPATAKSKRDEVWERKYAQWQRRNEQLTPSSQNHFGDQYPAQLPWLAAEASAPPAMQYQQQQHEQQRHPQQQQHQPPIMMTQQQQQHQQMQQRPPSTEGPRFGRRATADSPALPQPQPTAPQHQPQHQPQNAMMQAVANTSTRRGASGAAPRTTALW